MPEIEFRALEDAAMIQKPYLLFLGDAPDQLSAKVAQGIRDWRPEDCVGQIRMDGCKADVKIDDVSIDEAVKAGAKTLVIGVANRGGMISDAWISVLKEALGAGLDIASGLHNQLKRTGKRLLAVGTDCSVGKMYTALAFDKEMKSRGMKSSFRATGQTGILITGEGVPLDAVVADFMAGAIEYLTPDNDPDHWDIIEGQGSLFHASYSGVTMAYKLPSIDDVQEVALRLAKWVNPNCAVVGICVNTVAMSDKEASDYLASLEAETGLPCVDPFRHGVGPIVDNL